MTDDLLRNVRSSIFFGEMDTHLDLLQETIDKRREELKKQMFRELIPGTLVRFNSRVRPKYLIGVPATIDERKQKKVIVKLGQDVGRFGKGVPITTDIGMLEIIEPTDASSD